MSCSRAGTGQRLGTRTSERGDDGERRNGGRDAEQVGRDAAADPHRRRREHDAAYDDRRERECGDERGAPLRQPLCVLPPSSELDRPARELRHREQASGIDGRPLVDAAVSELPRIGAGEDRDRPREERRERPREAEREQDECRQRECAEREPVVVGCERDGDADSRGAEQRRECSAYAREYLA